MSPNPSSRVNTTDKINIFNNHGQTNQTMRVAELFAGVGGFRLGLEGLPENSDEGDFRVIWANQWEPASVDNMLLRFMQRDGQWNVMKKIQRFSPMAPKIR